MVARISNLPGFSVQSWAVMSEDGEPVVTERNVECHYLEQEKTEGRKSSLMDPLGQS